MTGDGHKKDPAASAGEDAASAYVEGQVPATPLAPTEEMDRIQVLDPRRTPTQRGIDRAKGAGPRDPGQMTAPVKKGEEPGIELPDGRPLTEAQEVVLDGSLMAQWGAKFHQQLAAERDDERTVPRGPQADEAGAVDTRALRDELRAAKTRRRGEDDDETTLAKEPKSEGRGRTVVAEEGGTGEPQEPASQWAKEAPPPAVAPGALPSSHAPVSAPVRAAEPAKPAGGRRRGWIAPAVGGACVLAAALLGVVLVVGGPAGKQQGQPMAMASDEPVEPPSAPAASARPVRPATQDAAPEPPASAAAPVYVEPPSRVKKPRGKQGGPASSDDPYAEPPKKPDAGRLPRHILPI